MSCCGARVTKTISQEEKLKQLKAYHNSLKRIQCSKCGSIMQILPNGTIICSVCGKRKS